MKRMMKYAAAAGVAGLFAIGLAAPTQAAPRHDMAPAGSYHTVAANMHNDYDDAGYGRFSAPGYGAYDYAPSGNLQHACLHSSQSPASPNFDECY